MKKRSRFAAIGLLMVVTATLLQFMSVTTVASEKNEYSSIDKAAIAFAKRYNGESIKKNEILYSAIYKLLDGNYVYTKPMKRNQFIGLSDDINIFNEEIYLPDYFRNLNYQEVFSDAFNQEAYNDDYYRNVYNQYRYSIQKKYTYRKNKFRTYRYSTRILYGYVRTNARSTGKFNEDEKEICYLPSYVSNAEGTVYRLDYKKGNIVKKAIAGNTNSIKHYKNAVRNKGGILNRLKHIFGRKCKGCA